MHIGFVALESPYENASGGGIAAYLRALIPALVERGERVTVIAGAKTQREFWAENGQVRVVHIKLPALHWYARRLPFAKQIYVFPLRQLEWSVAFSRHVDAVAQRDPFDIVEGTEIGSLFLSRIAPTVIRLHGSEWIFRKYTGQSMDLSVRANDWLEKQACEKADGITTPSYFQAREIVTRRGWKSGRVKVIPNPISQEMLQAGLDTPACSKTNVPIILYTGRLAIVKGVEILLKAATLVHQAIPEVTFMLVGSWQMPYPPQNYGLELGIRSSDGVLWVGPKPQAELVDFYRRATCFVMPSFYETFGISLLEAMAFGLPVVATAVGGLSEVAAGEAVAKFVPSGDSIALSLAILKTLGDAKIDEKQMNFPVQFTAERVASETINFYRQTMAHAKN